MGGIGRNWETERKWKWKRIRELESERESGMEMEEKVTRMENEGQSVQELKA